MGCRNIFISSVSYREKIARHVEIKGIVVANIPVQVCALFYDDTLHQFPLFICLNGSLIN